MAERVVQVGSPRDSALRDEIAALRPDAIAVACYSNLIPASITALAPVAVNVHPSLLPRHRGPDPLFWTLQGGDHQAGVTVHALAAEYDAGDIHAQQFVDLNEPVLEAELETRLALLGGRLLATLLLDGASAPTPQDATRATTESWWTDDDLILTPEWTIDRAWRCLYGLQERQLPFRYRHAAGEVAMGQPLTHGMGDDDVSTPVPMGDEAVLTFADGWLRVRTRN